MTKSILKTVFAFSVALNLTMFIGGANADTAPPQGYTTIEAGFLDQIAGPFADDKAKSEVLDLLNSGAIFTSKTYLYSADWEPFPLPRPHFFGIAGGCELSWLDHHVPVGLLKYQALKVKSAAVGYSGSFEVWDIVFEGDLWVRCYSGWFNFTEDIGNVFQISLPNDKLKQIFTSNGSD